jgi:hypothetical protein
LWAFWQSLAPAYAKFEATHRLPKITIDGQGGYHVAE